MRQPRPASMLGQACINLCRWIRPRKRDVIWQHSQSRSPSPLSQLSHLPHFTLSPTSPSLCQSYLLQQVSICASPAERLWCCKVLYYSFAIVRRPGAPAVRMLHQHATCIGLGHKSLNFPYKQNFWIKEGKENPNNTIYRDFKCLLLGDLQYFAWYN